MKCKHCDVPVVRKPMPMAPGQTKPSHFYWSHDFGKGLFMINAYYPYANVTHAAEPRVEEDGIGAPCICGKDYVAYAMTKSPNHHAHCPMFVPVLTDGPAEGIATCDDSKIPCSTTGNWCYVHHCYKSSCKERGYGEHAKPVEPAAPVVHLLRQRDELELELSILRSKVANLEIDRDFYRRHARVNIHAKASQTAPVVVPRMAEPSSYPLWIYIRAWERHESTTVEVRDYLRAVWRSAGYATAVGR